METLNQLDRWNQTMPAVSASRHSWASFSGTGKENRDEGNDITREDYPRGYALYAFDLCPDLAEEGHFNLAKQGTVRVELKFGAALPNTVTVVAYAEFEKGIEIDRKRNVIYDFGS